MRKVLTAVQMREVDRLTTERYGVPSILLMENAAHAVARVIIERLGGSVEGKSILILCGKGNNGGDGAAVARLLLLKGAIVKAILFCTLEEAKGDARRNFDRLVEMKVSHDLEICEALEWWQAWEFINARSRDDLACVVDAVFGTGLTSFRDDLNEILEGFASGWTIAVDIPSGLMADHPKKVDPFQYAPGLTVTFTAPKLANVLPPASRKNGELIVADIGSPPELVSEQPSQTYLAEALDAKTWLGKSAFTDDSYKNKRGHTVIFAGSDAYTGAAVLTGNAAMRSGVGLTTLFVPAACKSEIAARCLPEVIVRAPGDDRGEGHSDALSGVEGLVATADSITIGPGLQADDQEVEKLVLAVVANGKVPVIVDAGALSYFSPPSGIPSTDANLPSLILTPHEGEFLRLLGTEDREMISDRVGAVRGFATANNVILVLKGERVLIGTPDGRVIVNPTGNSGLGKAGNGDTLSGVLGGFVAQAVRMDIDIFETVVAAVYVAGLAGDIAERKYGKRVMTASDVRECLTEAFAEITGGHE